MLQIKNGSVKELWNISFPLIISLMSTFMMLAIDRLFMARYSHEALRACVTSGTLAWSVILGWITLATLSEVFVAQLNGAKKYDQIANPVWQMIWLSVISIFFFIPFAIYAAPLIYSPETEPMELIYFRWMMYTGPFAVFLASVTAFYIGQGKSNVAKWWSIFGNLCNVFFDSILIFGISNWIPAMGVKGASIATFLGYAIESICLFLVFTAKSNREKYQTNDCSFRFPLFKQCLRIGTPPATFATLEVFAWAVFYWLMAKISFDHIFVGGICQSILFLFIFFGMGLEKGAASLAGNLIGAGKKHLVNNVFKSGIKLILLYSSAMFLFFFIIPDPLIDLFIKNPETIDTLEPSSFVISSVDIIRYKKIIKQSLILITIYLTFENLRWLLSGLLTAAGDTFFLMIAGTSSVWLFLLAPTYYFIVLGQRSIIDAFYIWVGYSFLLSLVYFLRFKNGNWKKKNLIEEESIPEYFTISKDYEDF